ncbi:MAG: alkaline phosphatase family protein, partial [bacterium]
DCVKESWMPHLFSFARGGTWFKNHRSVFPTSTRVCTGTLVTGVYPRKHGLAGNALLARELRPPRVISTRDDKALAGWEKALSGKLLGRRTFFQALGGKSAGVILHCVSPGSAYIWNARKSASLLHPDHHWPEGFRAQAEASCGPIPPAGSPDLKRCEYILNFAAGHVLPKMKPRVLIIHLSEPDSIQHGIGVEGSLHRQTLRGLDRLLGEFLERLEETGIRKRANIIVMSDHGASGVTDMVDLEGEMEKAGLKGMGKSWTVAHSEGAALFYARRGGLKTLEPVAEFLRTRPWAGPLFSLDGKKEKGLLPGTFSLGLAGCGGARGPDLLMPFQWEEERGGVCYSSVNNKGSGGTHGSCSPYELNNFCAASGPAFYRRKSVTRPSGNIDIAPTILALSGRPVPAGLDGRPLFEGMRGAKVPAGKVVTETFQVEDSRASGGFLQTLRRTRVGKRFFLDWAKLERP